MRFPPLTNSIVVAVVSGFALACSAKESMNSDTTTVSDTLPAVYPPAPESMAQPKPEMKAVLDQLASLGGKPIETLSAAERTQWPSPSTGR